MSRGSLAKAKAPKVARCVANATIKEGRGSLDLDSVHIPDNEDKLATLRSKPGQGIKVSEQAVSP